MIMADLKTNYVDDKLDVTKNQIRKYRQIQNDDGTVSFVDVTEYTQVGTSFGAKDINDTNAAINEVNGKLSALQINLQSATISVETDSNGCAFLGYDYVFAVTTDSPNVTISIFNNQYNMWYAKIIKTSTGNVCADSKFKLFILCARNVPKN